MDKKAYYLSIAKEIKNTYSKNKHSEAIIWEKAYLLYDIIQSGEYLQDFNNRTELATYLKMDKSYLSKLITAVEYDKKYHFNHLTINVDKVYVLSKLGNKLRCFQKYLDKKNLSLETLKAADIRRLRDEYLSKRYSENQNPEYNRLYEKLLQLNNDQAVFESICELTEKEAKDFLYYIIKIR